MSIVPQPSQRSSAFSEPAAPSLAETLSVVDAVLASIGHRLPVQASREDLASAGKLALVEALLRFDGPAEEARAYCFVRVRGAVFDELRRLDPLSRHTRNQLRLVRGAAEALEHQFGRKPSPGEVAQATGFSVAGLAQLDQLSASAQACARDEVDRDGARSPNALSTPLDSVPDATAACPAHAAESDDTTTGVRAALSRLAPNHARVLQRYYLDEATLEEISAELNISKERVRQIREAAEKKLREDFIVLALWQSLLNRR
jgi:RNA polymerase sigma factor for flagellar operon FliA